MVKKYKDEIHKVVNTETGEIIGGDNCLVTITEIFEADEHIESENSEFFQNDITFIKSFRGNGVELNNRLTPAEIAAVMFLCDFMCYEDCVLRVGGNRKGNPLTVKDLAYLRGVEYDSFRKIISSLKKKQVVGYHNVKCITINPYIFCRGRKIEKWVIEYFKDSVWADVARQHMK